MKSVAALLLAAILFSACATHNHPAARRLRRAPGETADEFEERKEAVRDNEREAKEARRQMAEDAKNQERGFSETLGLSSSSDSAR